MSKKSDLIKLFMEFKERYNMVQAKITEIRKNEAYAQVGKEKAINNLMEEFKPTVQQYHDKAIEVIDGGLAALQEKWRANSTGRLSDAGYQMGLSNIIKIIESGAIHNRGDMQNIIETYKDDFNAMATIKNILSNGPQNLEFLGIIPGDYREQNKKLLGDLRNNVNLYLSPVMAVMGFNTGDPFLGVSSTAMTMDSMTDFVSTKLADDLTLIQ